MCMLGLGNVILKGVLIQLPGSGNCHADPCLQLSAARAEGWLCVCPHKVHVEFLGRGRCAAQCLV